MQYLDYEKTLKRTERILNEGILDKIGQWIGGKIEKGMQRGDYQQAINYAYKNFADLYKTWQSTKDDATLEQLKQFADWYIQAWNAYTQNTGRQPGQDQRFNNQHSVSPSEQYKQVVTFKKQLPNIQKGDEQKQKENEESQQAAKSFFNTYSLWLQQKKMYDEMSPKEGQPDNQNSAALERTATSLAKLRDAAYEQVLKHHQITGLWPRNDKTKPGESYKMYKTMEESTPEDPEKTRKYEWHARRWSNRQSEQPIQRRSEQPQQQSVDVNSIASQLSKEQAQELVKQLIKDRKLEMGQM